MSMDTPNAAFGRNRRRLGLRPDPVGPESQPTKMRAPCAHVTTEDSNRADGARFSRYRCRTVAVVLLLLTSSLAAGQPQAFRFSREVRMGEIEREELVAVMLDADVYAHTRDRLPDLRLIDATGREVPFLLEQATETRRQTVRNRWTIRPESLTPLDDGGMQIDLALDPQDPQPSGLTVETPLRDFEHRLRVFGSDDGATWESLVPDALIFDYSRFMDVRSRELRMPENDYRRFRVVIDTVTAEQESELMELTRRLRGDEEVERVERVLRDRRPFRIDRIEFWHEVAEQRVTGPATRHYPVAQFHADHDPDRKQTIVTVPTRREPLTAFHLETHSRNFTRRVRVERPETRGVHTRWQRIGEATLSRFAFRELQREQLEVTFPETRDEVYRLVIDNRDDPPLELTGLRAAGSEYRIVYFADADGAYRLVYGSAEVPSPQYDTTALAASLREGYEPLAAELGEVVESPLKRPAADFRALLNNPLLLIAVVGVLVAVLGWVLYAAARRVDAIPADRTSDE